MKLGRKLFLAVMGISVAAVLVVSIVALLQFVEARALIIETKQEENSELYETNISIMTESAEDSVRVFAASYAEAISGNIENIEATVGLLALDIGDLYAGETAGSSRFRDDMVYLQPGVDMEDVAEEFDRVKEARDLIDNVDQTFEKVSVTYYVSESGMLLSNLDLDYDSTEGAAIDRRTRDWYVEAIRVDGIYWTEVYQDALSGELALTCSCPVYNREGEVMGVVAQDVYLSSICDAIFTNSSDLFEYSFITDERGERIVGAGKRDNPDLEDEVRAIALAGGGDTVGIYPEKQAVLGHSEIRAKGWHFFVFMDYDTIAAPANNVGQAILESNGEFIEFLNKKIRGVLSAFLVIAAGTILVVLAVTSRITGSIVQPVEKLTEGVGKISKGDLDYRLTVEADGEIGELADAFRRMTVDLREYISNLEHVTAEKERIGAELDVATNIQKSMLPGIFPAFPDRKEVDIYAAMNPAKEVGGDFYDFFMVDERHLAIVVADVSGKGVPAALFMVIGKTLLKDHTQTGKDLGLVFSEVNDLLCESNSEGLFITAFEGVLDLVTGEFCFVNAGHETPFICKRDGEFKPYKVPAGFVLAGMEGMQYKCGSLQLEPGDRVFQYTDGVTEATDSHEELYGMERLEKVLCENGKLLPRELLAGVKADIDRFVGEAPQFDDITMLCMEYREPMADKTI